MKAGAKYENGSCTFTVWAPEKEGMILHIVHPTNEQLEMTKNEQGYFTITVNDCKPGAKYFFRPDGDKDYPDPASHYQPEGVHGPSAVVCHHSFEWKDEEWRGVPLKDLILYELHVGTFTPEGTFEAIIPRLPALGEIGINAIELMPINQFPGNRNWGYDGVYPYAVQNSYGGPEGLKKLVNACHQQGIAVFVDVVYNHMGPEGNYLSKFGPYFTSQYRTPWGEALNFDGDYSDGVREYFAENVIYWYKNYHIDGLRCDAIHTVYDNGAVHFWELCYDKIKEAEASAGRKFYMTAESDLNSAKVVNPPAMGGYGFDAQWLDDFHHALYVILDDKGKELYEDYGKLEQLAKAYSDGFVLSGEYVKFRKRKHGRSSAGVPGDKFIVFNQNHDQIGNRAKADRLCMVVNFERQKLAAAAILLAPYIPMLFMGEEYSDKTSFYYFVSHSDPDLIKAVQEGRKKEFENYKWNVEPPDPQDEKTFTNSTINWERRNEGEHKLMLQWVKQLISFRRSEAVMCNFNKNDINVSVVGKAGLLLLRQSPAGDKFILTIFNFSEEAMTYTASAASNEWHLAMHSNEEAWTEANKINREVPAKLVANEEVTIPPLTVVVFSSTAIE